MHAAKTGRAGAAQSSEKEKFQLILSMVGKNYRGAAETSGFLGEKIVPQFTRGHFQRETSAEPEFGDGSFARMKRQSAFFARFADEGFISVAFGAAQFVIKMRDMDFPIPYGAGSQEKMKQDHGIQPA
jgi:hypothetical protein